LSVDTITREMLSDANPAAMLKAIKG
jgi:hypothetical protein